MGTCFSSNVVKMCISWAGVTKLALGATYHRYSSNGQRDCIGGSADTCYLHCDEESYSDTFNCNNAGTCIFSCESEWCAWDAIVNGNSASLLEIHGDARGCLETAIVNAPISGDLHFDRMQGREAYKEMVVNAGANTGSIYIDCTYGDGNECSEIQVNAQTAQFLKIYIGNVGSSELDGGGDEKKDDPAYIYCPRDSDYSGPEEAPCVIENYRSMRYVEINAVYGTPRDMVMVGGGSRSKTDLICHQGTTTDFSTSSICYITHSPTPAPTNNPTPAPTPAPTANPTPAPTFNPTPAPTANPTPAPTKHPTPSPTGNPTPAPTSNPTPAPTENPTPAPTNNPTPAPTNNPTPAPTQNPTPAPTANPTPGPTQLPTKNPTTPSPTPPGTLDCGDSNVGPYNAASVDFMVNLPFEGDLKFDATNSSFPIVAMEARTELDTYIKSDGDNDGIITLVNYPQGNYKFTIMGDNTTSTYHVGTICTSSSPTPAPTDNPTPAPTEPPTPAPTENPTSQNPTPGPTKNPTSLAPTSAPTKDPSPAPTADPSPAPTDSPTDAPTPAPTDAPTDNPSPAPTDQPTPAPTDAPTDVPSPAPTDVPTAAKMARCGEQITGAFKGEPVHIIVNMPYESVDLEFDATGSDFMVTNIDAFIASGSMYLGSGISGKLTLQRLPTGYYKFIVHGTVPSGTYDVAIKCISSSPSRAPTKEPTPAPTTDPTFAPTSSPTMGPTFAPTVPPTAAPTQDDGALADDEVITQYEIRVVLCEASDRECDFSESDVTSLIEQLYPNIDVNVDEVRTVGNTVIMDVSVKTHEDDVLDSATVKEDIDMQFVGEYPEVDVDVEEIEEESMETIVDFNNVNVTELFKQYKYLVFMVVLFAGAMCCCCLGCLLFWRKQQSQKQAMQLQWLELNKMQKEVNDGNPSSGANTTNTSGTGEEADDDEKETNGAGEGGDAEKKVGDTDFDGQSMLINGGLPAPYVFVTPKSPSSEEEAAAAPRPMPPQMSRPVPGPYAMAQMNQNMMMQMAQMNQMQPPPQAMAAFNPPPAAAAGGRGGEQADEEDYEYYYDTDEDAAEEIYNNNFDVPVMQTPGS